MRWNRTNARCGAPPTRPSSARPTSYPGTGTDIKRDMREEALNLAMEILIAKLNALDGLE